MGAVVHIYHSLADEIGAVVRQNDPARDLVLCRTEDELRAAIASAEVLLTGVPPEKIFANAPNLRWIQNMGAGVDRLLPAPELNKDVRITCSRGIYAPQVAEHAVALLLALQRGLASHMSSQLEHSWHPFASSPLAGKVLAVLGLGEIGSRVARIAGAMDMRVVGISRTAKPTEHVDVVALASELGAVLRDVDALVVTVPLTAATHKMVGEAEIAAMPRHAVIVNIGRGPVIDEKALLAALFDGQIGGAGLDVFETEPLPSQSPWWTAPNTIVTPHCSGTTVNHLGGIARFFATNLIRYDAGEPLLNPVDRELGY